MLEQSKVHNQSLDFEEYTRVSEPHKRERAYAWRTAIGLQAVDGLQVSDYLKQTARRNIEGEITIDEARELIKSYYQSKTNREPDDDEKQEADKVSGNVVKIINEQSFTFSVAGFISIHRHLFEGVFKHAGKLRDYDITKKEWVLREETVLYGRWQDLRMTLEYDLEQEKQFDYAGLTMEQVVEHIAKFVSGIWQIHPFREGNTRTTAVFTIKYLQSIGFNVTNDLFQQHSWYFRNALVRANYRNVQKGINPDNSFLILFFRNLLMGEKNDLKNRYMVVNPSEDWGNPTSSRQVPDKYPTSTEQVPNKYRTSTEQAPNKLEFSQATENDSLLISSIGNSGYTLKQLMEKMGLKHRPTFMENYLNPAIENGFVRLMFPDKPKHPRQKYLLTVKGLALYNELKNKE